LISADLQRILLLTAALIAVIAMVGLLFSPAWSVSLLVAGVLAIANYFMLAVILLLITSKQRFFLFAIAPLKLVTLLSFAVAGKMGLLEFSSFFVAMNAFFVAALVYTTMRGPVSRLIIPQRDGIVTNG